MSLDWTAQGQKATELPHNLLSGSADNIKQSDLLFKRLKSCCKIIPGVRQSRRWSAQESANDVWTDKRLFPNFTNPKFLKTGSASVRCRFLWVWLQNYGAMGWLCNCRPTRAVSHSLVSSINFVVSTCQHRRTEIGSRCRLRPAKTIYPHFSSRASHPERNRAQLKQSC